MNSLLFSLIRKEEPMDYELFSVAYDYCSYLSNHATEPFEPYEVAMYTAEMVECLKMAIERGCKEPVNPYFDTLYDELKNVSDQKEVLAIIQKIEDVIKN